MGLVSGTGLIIIHLFLLYLACPPLTPPFPLKPVHRTDSPSPPSVIFEASAGRHGATTLKVRGVDAP